MSDSARATPATDFFVALATRARSAGTLFFGAVRRVVLGMSVRVERRRARVEAQPAEGGSAAG
jgi:hypothetical protein